jgi:hypothetical protein
MTNWNDEKKITKYGLTLDAPKGLTAGATGVSLPRVVRHCGKQVATLTYTSCYGTMTLSYNDGIRKAFTSEDRALRFVADWVVWSGAQAPRPSGADQRREAGCAAQGAVWRIEKTSGICAVGSWPFQRSDRCPRSQSTWSKAVTVQKPETPIQTTISMDFGEEVSDAIREIQRLGRYRDIHEAMGSILGTALYLHQHQADGWRILVNRDGKYKEVYFVERWSPNHGW